MNYGNTLMAKGDFNGALDYFHRALAFAPQYSVLLINLAIAEDATKQDAAAEQHFKDALRLAPASPDSYTYYARYLLSHSRAEEARAFLHSALELSSTDLTARELLAQAEVRRAINRQRKQRSLISLSAFSVMAKSATRNRLLLVEPLSSFGRVTLKPGITSALPTINSAATSKPQQQASRRSLQTGFRTGAKQSAIRSQDGQVAGQIVPSIERQAQVAPYHYFSFPATCSPG